MFKYLDRVRVKQGFFQGTVGTVVNEHKKGDPEYGFNIIYTYDVEFDTKRTVCFNEDWLELVHDER